jgi:hypothetical protein
MSEVMLTNELAYVRVRLEICRRRVRGFAIERRLRKIQRSLQVSLYKWLAKTSQSARRLGSIAAVHGIAGDKHGWNAMEGSDQTRNVGARLSVRQVHVNKRQVWHRSLRKS